MKKVGFIIFISIMLLLSLNLTSAFWPFDWFEKGIVTGRAITPSCTDSDGGLNTDIAGTVTCGASHYNDKCYSSNAAYVYEYYYDDGIDDYNARYIACTSGKTCLNGACVAPTSSSSGSVNSPLCGDSDGGKNPNVAGTVMVGSAKYSDGCWSQGGLYEYYCVGETYNYDSVTCPNGCINGACIGASTTTTISNGSTSSPVPSCTDSDANKTYPDGKNIGLAGKVTCGADTYSDACYSSNSLYEYYYDSGIDSYNGYYVTCPINTFCKEGACISSTSSSTPVAVECKGNSCNNKNNILKLVLIRNNPSVSQQREIDILQDALKAKSPDLVVLDEDFFQGYTGLVNLPNPPYLLTRRDSSEIKVSQGNDFNTFSQFKQLQDLSKQHKIYIVAPAITIEEGNTLKKTAALIIGPEGKVIAEYYKNDPFIKINFKTQENVSYTGVIQICTTLADYQRLSPNVQQNADILIHPAWGGWEYLGQAVMEYKQTGTISEKTYLLLSTAEEHKILLSKYNLNSREELIKSIKEEKSPFDWLHEFKEINAKTNVINPQGYLISADQITTNAVIGIDEQKLNFFEYSPDYSYMYAEIELPASSNPSISTGSAEKTCTDGTLYGSCSKNKPRYCKIGDLVNNCNLCGCETGSECTKEGICTQTQNNNPELWGIGIENFEEGAVYPIGTFFKTTFLVTGNSLDTLKNNKYSVDISLKNREKGSTIGIYFADAICIENNGKSTGNSEVVQNPTLLCTVNWPVSEGSFTDENTYIIRVVAKSSPENNLLGSTTDTFKIDKEKEVSFRLRPINTDLCKEVISDHNNPAANRANVVFVGIGYGDRDFIGLSCHDAMYKYCKSIGYSGYEKEEYLSEEKSMKFTCFDKNKQDLTFVPKSPVEKKFSLIELQTYDSNCKVLPVSPGEVLKGIAAHDIDKEGDNDGLLSVEPFKSNKDKFNFWYVDQTVPYSRCKEQESSQFFACYDKLLEANALAANCIVPNKYVIYTIADYFRSSAGDKVYLSSAIDRLDAPYVDQARVFVHEFGHQFGDLADEYIETSGSVWNEISQSGRLDCYVPSPATETMCLQNAPWKEFIGNGCGKEGLTDCNEKDEFYNNEVGCFEGCSLTEFGIFRPTRNSIMRCHTCNPFTFGPWNEKLIKDKMSRFTGK